MSDGIQTLMYPNSVPGVFVGFVHPPIVDTDAAGRLIQWNLELSIGVINIGIEGQMSSQEQGTTVEDIGEFVGQLATGVSSVSNNPGEWVLTPEPNTATLLAIGFVAMAGVWRRNV